MNIPPPYNIPTTGADPTTRVRFTVMAARALNQQELVRAWLTYLGSKEGRKVMRGTVSRIKKNTTADVIILTVIS